MTSVIASAGQSYPTRIAAGHAAYRIAADSGRVITAMDKSMFERLFGRQLVLPKDTLPAVRNII